MKMRKIAVTVLVALGLLFAVQAPAWQQSSIAMPTNFAPGSAHATDSGPESMIPTDVLAPPEASGPGTIVALLVALSIAPWMAFRERDRINQALQQVDHLRCARAAHTTRRAVR